MRALAVIPARYNSTRFPGKPIRAYIGKSSMIKLTYEQAKKSNASDVVVATDDKRIYEHVLEFGGKVVMTEHFHKTGTERLMEVRAHQDWSEYDAYINVQGDEPFIDPEQINEVIKMVELRDYSVATLHAKCESLQDLMDPNIVKQVVSHEKVLYSSRSPIPWPGEKGENFDKYDYYVHLGIYGFPRNVLDKIDLDYQPPIQAIENLEQLNWAATGIEMYSRLSDWQVGINTVEDLIRVGGSVADEIPYRGCTNPNSYNYEPNATVDDGSCEPYPEIPEFYRKEFDALNFQEQQRIYGEYRYYLTDETSKLYPMNNSRLIGRFWASRNLKQNKKDE